MVENFKTWLMWSYFTNNQSIHTHTHIYTHVHMKRTCEISIQLIHKNKAIWLVRYCAAGTAVNSVHSPLTIPWLVHSIASQCLTCTHTVNRTFVWVWWFGMQHTTKCGSLVTELCRISTYMYELESLCSLPDILVVRWTRNTHNQLGKNSTKQASMWRTTLTQET